MYNQINYKSNYKKIVEIQIKHDFFKSNNCSVFEIRPDIETQNLIKNYGIIFKKISSRPKRLANPKTFALSNHLTRPGSNGAFSMF